MAIKIRREGEGIAEREFMGDPPTYDTFRDKVLVIHQTATGLIPGYEGWEEEVVEDGIKRSVALAKRITALCDRLLDAIDNGNGEQIGWLAFELGELYERMVIKCHWEDHALRGRLIVRGAVEGGLSRDGMNDDRDQEMAEEFRRRRGQGGKSDTALKTEIGRARGLKRSAALAAVDRGLKISSG